MPSSPETRTLTASEGRQRWSKMLNDVFRGYSRFVVERNDIPIAAIVSMADLQRLREFDEDRQKRFRILERIGVRFANEESGQVERSVASALAEVREQVRADVSDAARR